ncbi:MAG: hypothetical protein ACE5GE_01595 [Phycisphaerae bacterium]
MRKAPDVKYLLSAAVVWVVGVALVGCTQEPERIVILRPEVAWPDLGLSKPDIDSDGFDILAPEWTQGLFPASMAVARVSVADPTKAGARNVVLDMQPANDFLPWNSTFDSLRYVSDAFPMHALDLSGDAPTTAKLCSAATDLSARICLVYAGTDLSERRSRVRGVLFDARSGAALARIQAQAEARDPELTEPPPGDVEEDLRHCDARVLADQSFAKLVFECVRELKRRDRAAPVESQEGWTPAGPVLPRFWPPLRDDEQRQRRR